MINANKDKLRIHDIQEYDSDQIKKEELSGDIIKFPPVQWHSLPS